MFRQELSELIRNKPEDEQRKNNNIEENHFLKKFTNLFYTKKNTQENINKIDPSVYTLDEKQPTDEEEKKMEKKSSPLLDIETDSIKNNETQIELLDINEDNSKNLDENVLEIPAFLRRQAN